MGLQYSQTLIAEPKDFVPRAPQVGKFFTAMVALGVVPGDPKAILRTPSGKTREYPSVVLQPRPGETGEKWKVAAGTPFVVEMKDNKELARADQIADSIAGLSDYEIEVSGVGIPRTPPVPIDFTDPYCVSVTCFVSTKLRSTSNLHDRTAVNEDVVRYRRPCPADATTGYFTNPHTGEAITVPGAGCARFWVQFELGEFLCPQLENSLDILNPSIVAETRSTFGVQFVQGCFWG